MGESILDNPGWPRVITSLLLSERERQENQNQRSRNRSAEIAGRATGQGRQAASRSWKRQGGIFSP